MQCEEVEAPAPEMTFNDSRESPETKTAAQILEDSKFDSRKFEEINLEDDIEKVEVSSGASSETNEEEFVEPAQHLLPEQNPNESIKSWLQRITDLQKQLSFDPPPGPFPLKPSPQPTPNRVVKFQDLPYMGEMTLDNSKPRRGRKPKKADICHLIYKNYGTIFPGTPNPKSYLEKETNKKSEEPANRSDVQNRIISSLLEKRLTQEIKKTDVVVEKSDQNEPLNLCIRDLNHLKIRLLKKNELKSEPGSDDDVEFVHETPSPGKPEPLGTPPEAPGGYVYWPNAGVFIHPMALQQQLMYYQRMAANNSYTLPSHSPRPPPPDPEPELRKITPKARKKPEETEPQPEQKTKRNASTSSDKTPTKRKRSAIFIPPIPPENNTNSATEVSICKFKFTGGAKPSLQEKKMLSVDSGGNFRYYSGTGDKSMRGYEFFPRETLQQQINNSQGSSTGAFLQASGEKIYPVAPVDFTGTKPSQEFLLAPEAPPTPDLHRHKKRKSRKSLQREKLEQTFKEKGFLIQTQQLESAEGATYCKFRQLRKFTRYLFRSWKDYLPGNVRELQEGEKPDEEDGDNLSRHSSELQ
ncbi:uncharacterized protein LOC663686 isoform X2 [Tribolium castaneum]|nr:PREDICTED: uncharacterized protein LOC663686 isoform X2 [Tribolium castaneum]EFA02048.2 hypothetical protein TcasGA2_TC007676 [Tribolium castaneum]|eukprot:XP_008191706.1 PREDICTED: uncharacterized protein LOC663686 isoform X2 [Tribolium castaneum]